MRGRTRLANDAWESLLRAHSQLIRELRGEDIWSPLSMREYDVLYTLSKQARPLRIGELGTHVLLSQPALSRLVDRLIYRGLLSREPDPLDRRVVLVSLTEVGRDAQATVGRRHARSVARALGGRLDAAEMATLEELTMKLTGHSGAHSEAGIPDPEKFPSPG